MKKLFSTLALAFVTTCSFAQYANTTFKTGDKAPDLAFNNPQEKVIKLSELNKGRVVLLDFWASWCRPCRAANPRLVELYKRYKDKSFKNAKNGFTIVSVSLDQDKASWIKAIETDNLIWPNHMSDLGSWNSKAAEKYGVQYIPQAFLIGADGKIIGAYNTAEEAEPDLQKLVKG